MQIIFRPLDVWPQAATLKQKRGPFGVSYAKSLALLDRELGLLKASNVVIQAYFAEHELRNDGMPRLNATPRLPGVIVSFDCEHGRLSYPCDTYTDWQSNIRAISLTLENLRAIGRHGASNRGEQFKGYKALPAPGQSAPTESREVMVAWLRSISGLQNGDIATLVRTAEVMTHPDKGGNPDDFKTVQRFRKVLLPT
jgi:hypothetical protein